MTAPTTTSVDATGGVPDPVAVVQVDTGLPHLDRPFEYAVPAALAESARPGVRVKVRFAGQDLAGYVLDRRPTADHDGRLSPLRTVVSDEPVLTPPIRALARELADAYAGTIGDVLRLAIPPRHARAEKALDREPEPLPPPEARPSRAWDRYAAGPALLRRLASGESPGAAWLALPSPTDPELDWPMALAEAAAATLRGGRGSVLIVPDHRDLARLDAALLTVLGKGRHVRLSAEQGPQARYTAWLKALRGGVQIVAGNRAAAFAPVRDLGLLAVWDDGDDLHEEPRAPYPHVRDIAVRRARIERAGVLIGGFARSVPAQQLIETGVLRPVSAPPDVVRAATARVNVAGEDRDLDRDGAAARARLPSSAWRAAKEALTRGPVLVQVPRRGYVPALACARCRTPARCGTCHGPLMLAGADGPPTCRWCASVARGYTCPECGARELRSLVVGARRTAEELGRAFPGVPVLTSGGDTVLADVPTKPALVIATPGAEPVAAGGYAAALLLDAWALLDRSSLNAGPEALRRWLAAAALVVAHAEGGQVVLCGAPPHATLPPIEALVRWDPAGLAEREFAERVELALPPAVTFAQVLGPRRAVDAVAAAGELGPGIARFGPLPRPDGSVRLLLRATPAETPALASALTSLRGARSARKDEEQIAIRFGLTDLE